MAMYTVVTPKYRTPAYRPARTAVFVSLGLSAVVPVGHAWHLYGVRGSLQSPPAQSLIAASRSSTSWPARWACTG